MFEASSIINSIEPALPGLLALFDFADFKRRNDHLGYLKGNEDIEKFESVLMALANDISYFKRVAGDKWIVLSKDAEIFKTIIEAFKLEQRVVVGWECNGVLNSEHKHITVTLNSLLHRAVRCLYVEIVDATLITEVIEALLAEVWAQAVNVPVLLRGRQSQARQTWQCIEYPNKAQTCLFCDGRNFAYLDDGTIGPLSMDCRCKDCGAELRFGEVFKA